MERPRHPGAGGTGAALDRLDGTTRATVPRPHALPKPYGGRGTFAERLEGGRLTEWKVARWLEAHGRRVTILADGATDDLRGPRLTTVAGKAVAPDLLVAHPRSGHARLIEVKERRTATWHRHGRCWTTGIPLLDLGRIEEAQECTGLPCWLAVVLFGKGDRYERGQPPPPAGLFVAPVRGLRARMSHSYANAGMAYWRVGDLCRLASLDDLEAAAP